jgi:hypothetical protein
MRSSEFTTVVTGYAPERERPGLRVFYTAGAFAVPAAIRPLIIGPTQIQVPFTGTAGYTYSVWRSTAVKGPWSLIGTATIGATTSVTFTDAAPLAGGAFYRISYP